MKYANSDRLIKCNGCQALYDKTLSWERGYYNGTSNNFVCMTKINMGCCPMCGNKNQ